MTALIALIALSVVPIDNKVEIYDLVEINHEYSDQGELFCTSLIFRDWNGKKFLAQDYRREFVGWPVLSTSRFWSNANATIERDWANGGYVIRFFDETETYHHIRVKQKTETWTQYWPLDNEPCGKRLLIGPRPCEPCS